MILEIIRGVFEALFVLSAIAGIVFCLFLLAFSY
jgi:hypothetical protein